MLTLKGHSQPTKAPIRSASKTVTIPELKARIIYADLQKYPLVLKERNKLRTALSAQESTTTSLRAALVAKDTALAAAERRLYFEGVLRQDAAARAGVWKAKAKKRSWVITGLTLLLVGVTYTAIR